MDHSSLGVALQHKHLCSCSMQQYHSTISECIIHRANTFHILLVNMIGNTTTLINVTSVNIPELHNSVIALILSHFSVKLIDSRRMRPIFAHAFRNRYGKPYCLLRAQTEEKYFAIIAYSDTRNIEHVSCITLVVVR